MTTRAPHETSRAVSEPTLHLSIRGLVQGVGFRDALSLQAMQRHADGWVRNRRDGSVEAVVRADRTALQTLIRWAQQGPPAARVDSVDTRPATAEETATVQPGFRRLPTH